MITVSWVHNILEHPEKTEEYLCPWESERRVRDYLPQAFGADRGHVVILNDRALTGLEVDRIKPHDRSRIWLGSFPQDPATITVLIVLLAVSIGVSYAIQALTAPPSLGKTRNEEDSPSRNFEGIQDTFGTGVPVQWIFGKVRVGGHILSSFERLPHGEDVPDGVTVLQTLISWGRGPYKSIGSFQINGNALANLPQVATTTRLGTYDQATIDGFGEVLQEVVYRTPLSKAEGELRFSTIREVEGFEVIFRFPRGLFKLDVETGKKQFLDVEFQVEAFEIGGPGYKLFRKSVSARTANPYKVILRVAGLDLARYDIRVVRLTQDDDQQGTGSNFVSTSEVFAISELTTDEGSANPGLALTGFSQVPSAQLNSSVPTTYTALIEGLTDIRVYSSDTAYTEQYTENVAWCCARFICDPENGMGERYSYEKNIDIPAFRAWAAYCDTQVPNMKGGFEVRAPIGKVQDSQENAQDILQIFQQLGDGIVLKEGRRWTVVIDQRDELVWIANPANIFPGTLKYTYVRKAERANRLHLTFQDAERDYQRESHPEELPDLADGERYVDAQRDLFGATRRSHVARQGVRFLLYNKLAKRRVELEAGIDAIRVRPGRLFGLNLITVGVGLAGGILLEVDSTGTRLRLDEEVKLEAGKIYEIFVQHEGDKIDQKRVISPAGDTEWVIVSDEFWTQPIKAGAKYSLGEEGGAIERFRCLEVTRQDDEFRRRIIGLLYDEGIYTGDPAQLPVRVPSSIPDPRRLPPIALDLSLVERQEFEQDGTLTEVIDVDWTAPVSALIAEWEVWYRLEATTAQETSWALAGTLRPGTTSFELRNVQAPGATYVIAVVSVSGSGQKLAPADSPQARITTVGRTERPPNLAGLSATIIDGKLIASVSPLTPGELGPGGFYHWKLGTNWARSKTVAETVEPRLELSSYPHGTVNVLVKAVNSIGLESPLEASVSITLYGQIEENVVLTSSQAPSWSGTRSGFVLEGTTLTLLELASAIAPRPRRYQRGRLRAYGFGAPAPTIQSKMSGSYTTPIITVHTAAIRARADLFVDFTPVDLSLGTWDQATFTWADPKAMIPWSGSAEAKIKIRVFSRISTTGTAESDFGQWLDHLDRGELTMRYIQFRVDVTLDSDAQSIVLHDVKVTIDVPDRYRTGSIAVPSANPVVFTYEPASYFVEVRSLLITVTGGAAGDTARVTAESASGFTVEIRDSVGALKAGTIRYQAVGY